MLSPTARPSSPVVGAIVTLKQACQRLGRLVDLEILADLKIMAGRPQNLVRQPKLPIILSNIGKFCQIERMQLMQTYNFLPISDVLLSSEPLSCSC